MTLDEYRRLCLERAHELARKPYPLTAEQIAERTGVSRDTACKIIWRERRAAGDAAPR